MENVYVKQLRPHPMNDQLFDPMPDDVWPDFCKSIKERGVIEPLIIDQKNTIISGHQRIRACKAIGYTGEVPVIRKYYATEDDRVKDLIEINILQRGKISSSPKKEALRIKTLERIYGIVNGNNQHNEGSANGPTLTQEQLAEKLGINLTTLKRAKKLSELPEEIQDMVDSGKISLSTAVRVIAGLSPEEQNQLIEQLPAKDKITNKEVVELTAKLKEANRLICKYEKDLQYQSSRELELKSQLEEMRNSVQPETTDVDLSHDTIFFVAKIDSFLKDLGGYAYLASHFKELPGISKQQYLSSVQAIQAWAGNIINAINDQEAANG